MVWWVPLAVAGANLVGSMMASNKSDKNAASTAGGLGELPGVGKQYYEPFITAGNRAQGQASGAYEKMLQNPASFVEQLMSTYKPSQGYDFRKKNAMDAARNSAASGGFSGTRNDQMQQAGLADNLLSQDMQQYLQTLLGVHGEGLQGQQHVGDMGFQASGSLADYIGNAIGSSANLSHAQNAQKNSNMGGILGGIGGLAGAAMPMIGSMFGGGGGGAGGGMAGMGSLFGGSSGGGGGGFSGGGANRYVPSSRFNNASSIVNGTRGFSGAFGGFK